MPLRPPAGFIRPGFDPLKNPNAPTIGILSNAGDSQLSLAFTAPTNVGGSAITSYLVTVRKTSNGAIFSAVGAVSPVTITGLINGDAYTATVVAINSYGPSSSSVTSNSAVPAIVQGQQEFTTAGTYSWVVPDGVTSVSIVAVGGGGGSWNNGGTTSSAGDSYFSSTAVVKGGAGSNGGGPGSGGSGGTITGTGGGSGGDSSGYGGGGAGGYSGSGGTGGSSGNNYLGTSGSGGGGGGGGYGGGGGVGILGQGSNGVGANQADTATGGSGGGNAGLYNAQKPTVTGGLYGGGGTGWGGSGGGGGGGGLGYRNNYAVVPGTSYTVVVGAGGVGTYSIGAKGAVRIIWPGATRQFPSTDTGNI